MLRLKPMLITGGLLLTILAAAVYSYTSLQNANERLAHQVDALTAELAQREAEAERLARDIESVEAVNDELLAERVRLAGIEERYQTTTEKLIEELATAQQAVNELRQSDHEDVKNWANTGVPDSALRLLSNARATRDNSDDNDNIAYFSGAAVQFITPVYRSQF